MPNLLTVSEVAEYFKTTPTTIYRWLREGKIDAVKIGKEWRVDEDTLHAKIHGTSSILPTRDFWDSIRDREHIMVLAEKDDDIYRLEADFFKHALSKGAVIMKGLWWQDEDETISRYEHLGMDASSLMDDERLSIINLKNLYDRFGVEGPVRAWRTSIQRATDSGYTLWASGSPNLNCCGTDCQKVVSFETQLDKTLRSMPVVGICPYSLEDQSNCSNFGGLTELMRHHGGVAFYSGGEYTLLRH